MIKLNYDLIPEELKRESVDACFSFEIGEMQVINRKLQKYKQAKKPVDMSVLVNSGVLCEFSGSKDFSDVRRYGFLESITEAGEGATLYGEKAAYAPTWYCRPLYGHWHSAKNFDVDEIVKALRRAGFKVEVDCEAVIEHFRITGIHPDRCEPWEV